MAWADLAEHTDTLVAVLGVLVALCAGLIGVIYKIMMNIALTLKTDILDMINKLGLRVDDVWHEIGEIRRRQEALREQIPKEYLRIDGPGYKVLADAIKRIEEQINNFLETWHRKWPGSK